MRCFRSSLAPLTWAALFALSCSSPTGVDRNAGTDVAAVSVDPQASTVIVGTDVPLHAAVIDAAGNVVPDAPVVWTVRDADIAAVSASGVVTGRAVGSTQVAASAGGRSAVATITVQPPPVASVVVQPGTVSLAPGSTATLKAVVTDVNGAPAPDRAVKWTTSDALVAVVSTTGVVTAVGPGSATIGAESEGKTGTATVAVSPVPVASIIVEPGSVTVLVGGSATLTATVKDAAGNVLLDRAVSWTTSNVNVATVTSTGSVTGVAPGTATISATINGKSAAAAVTVTLVPVATVAIAPAAKSLVAGSTTTLVATVKDANGATVTNRVVTWSTSDSLVARVSSTGVVTAVAPGSATITATSETKVGSSTITVTPVPVATVVVQPPTLGLRVGGTATVTAVLKDANGNPLTGRVVTWTSSNPAIAKVVGGAGQTAVVTGVAPGGPAFITAFSEGWNGSAAVTVTPVPVAIVTLPAATTLVAGQSTTLVPELVDSAGAPATGRVVTWSSSNPNVATVSQTGVVKSLITGQATITATSEGKTGSTLLTVTPAAVASITLLPSTPTVASSSTVTIAPTVKDINGTTVTDRAVTWKSSNDAVATVSPSGVVTGLLVGTATITATSESKSGTATVTVVPGPAATVTVAPAAATIRDGSFVQLGATAADAHGNPITGRAFTWATNNGSVATVSSSGRVTGRKAGLATITATLDNANDTSQVTVTP